MSRVLFIYSVRTRFLHQVPKSSTRFRFCNWICDWKHLNFYELYWKWFNAYCSIIFMDFYSIQLNYLIEMIYRMAHQSWHSGPSHPLTSCVLNVQTDIRFLHFSRCLIFTCGIAFEICWFKSFIAGYSYLVNSIKYDRNRFSFNIYIT